MKKTKKQHKERHKLLHEYLDELIGDYITQRSKGLSATSLLEFVEWSYLQTLNPTEEKVRK